MTWAVLQQSLRACSRLGTSSRSTRTVGTTDCLDYAASVCRCWCTSNTQSVTSIDQLIFILMVCPNESHISDDWERSQHSNSLTDSIMQFVCKTATDAWSPAMRHRIMRGRTLPVLPFYIKWGSLDVIELNLVHGYYKVSNTLLVPPFLRIQLTGHEEQKVVKIPFPRGMWRRRWTWVWRKCISYSWLEIPSRVQGWSRSWPYSGTRRVLLHL